MNGATQLAIDFTERGWIPDAVIRTGVRHLVRGRLREIGADDCETVSSEAREFINRMNEAVIAPLPEKANEQHYELPPEFFSMVLGRQRKYSCCYWPDGIDTLDDAEEAALRMTAARAGIEDGMKILELGCGWGSLTLWMASRFPGCQVTAVSNSSPQREYIHRQARKRGLNNLRVITSDMNEFKTSERFDRVISVEMFEHMRNYRELFRRINDWLHPGGKFFMHIFCHRSTPYAFEAKDASDWMSRNFFSGGIMPSDDLPLRFQEDLKLSASWRWSGRHYERTANAWLMNMDRRREAIWPILERTYGEDNALRWWIRWRLFFIACAELFGYQDGQQWWVSHYLFERSDSRERRT